MPVNLDGTISLILLPDLLQFRYKGCERRIWDVSVIYVQVLACWLTAFVLVLMSEGHGEELVFAQLQATRKEKYTLAVEQLHIR